jgi:hypothetical protein
MHVSSYLQAQQQMRQQLIQWHVHLSADNKHCRESDWFWPSASALLHYACNLSVLHPLHCCAGPQPSHDCSCW